MDANSVLPHPENFNMEKVGKSAEKMQKWLGDKKPMVALTLGSGLGGFGKDIPGAKEVDYHDLCLPMCHVEGHAGKLRFVPIGKQGVLVFDGRIHCYEGHDFQTVVRGVRAATLLGVKTHIITCASGGINSLEPGHKEQEYKPGDLVLITNHLNLMGGSPLEGSNNSSIGPRFPGMTHPYDPELHNIARGVMYSLGLAYKCGVYAAMRGPCYETAAEVRMLRILGANMAGMSTVPEVITLRHMDARVLAISCVTNLAAGSVPNQSLSHDEVVKTGKDTASVFRQLLTGIINKLPA